MDSEESHDARRTLESTLRTKLLDAKAVLQETRQRVETKERYLQSVVSELNMLASGIPPQMQSESQLVDLLQVHKCTEEPSTTVCVPAIADVLAVAPMEILGIWKRVHAGKWILGVDVKNKCTEFICIDLIASSQSCSISSETVVFSYDKRSGKEKQTHVICQGLEPDAKASVVTSLDFAILAHLREISVQLSLTLRKPSAGSHRPLDPECLFLYCGAITLCVEDIITNSHEVTLDPHPDYQYLLRNLAAMSALAITTIVQLESIHTDLQEVMKLISASEKFKWSPTFEIFHTCGDKNLDVWFEVHEYSGPHQRGMKLYTRDTSQLYLLVHLLYDVLPDDVIISIQPNRKLSRVGKLLSCMHHEADHIVDGITGATRSKFKDVKVKSNDLSMDKSVSIAQKAAASVQIKQQTVEMDKEEYHRFRLKLREFEELTDAAIARLFTN